MCDIFTWFLDSTSKLLIVGRGVLLFLYDLLDLLSSALTAQRVESQLSWSGGFQPRNRAKNEEPGDWAVLTSVALVTGVPFCSRRDVLFS